MIPGNLNPVHSYPAFQGQGNTFTGSAQSDPASLSTRASFVRDALCGANERLRLLVDRVGQQIQSPGATGAKVSDNRLFACLTDAEVECHTLMGLIAELERLI